MTSNSLRLQSGTNWDSQNAHLNVAFLNMILLITTQIKAEFPC